MDCSPSFRREALPFSREMDEKEWRKLLDRLFCKLYVHEWKKSYVDPYVLDGEQWGLEFQLTGRRVRNYGGTWNIVYTDNSLIFRVFSLGGAGL